VLQFQIASNVLSDLIYINNESISEEDLAETWEVSDDGLIYTINLREGVTFNNGDPSPPKTCSLRSTGPRTLNSRAIPT